MMVNSFHHYITRDTSSHFLHLSFFSSTFHSFTYHLSSLTKQSKILQWQPSFTLCMNLSLSLSLLMYICVCVCIPLFWCVFGTILQLFISLSLFHFSESCNLQQEQRVCVCLVLDTFDYHWSEFLILGGCLITPWCVKCPVSWVQVNVFAC